MHVKKNNTVISLVFFLCLHSFISMAQEDEPLNLVYQSSVVGVGNINIFDTYLSPQNYSGTSVGLFHEQMKMTNIMKGNVSSQQLFSLDFSWAKNAAETGTDYSAFMEYSNGLHYRFHPAKNLQLFTGGQANGLLGFIYNTRNGNNPASAKMHLNLNLSAIAAYQIKIKSQPLLLRYQVNIPFLGVMFSPHYGQSYYEIYLGDNDNLVNFSSFHNQIILKSILSLEIPFNSTILRLSYMNSVYETKVNSLETRIHSSKFYVGFSKNFFSVSGKKTTKGKYKRVFE